MPCGVCDGAYKETPGAPKNDVGFPFSTNGYKITFGSCGPNSAFYTFKPSDFNKERLWNITYIAVITGSLFGVYRLMISKNPKSSRKVPRL